MPNRAHPLATKIFEGFLTYIETFNTYTRLAPLYFAQRNWQATQLNHRQRLRLYKDLLFKLTSVFQEILGEDVTVQVARRSELHTFAVIPKRWVVERSFAWLEKNRRLWKNCERWLNTILQFIHLAFLACSS